MIFSSTTVLLCIFTIAFINTLLNEANRDGRDIYGGWDFYSWHKHMVSSYIAISAFLAILIECTLVKGSFFNIMVF